VLDNCEHLIGAAAELCAGLLAACDDLRVLATSREPLAVAGEARYRLGPLPLPGDHPGEAAGSEAIALFADRARQADAAFALTGETGPVVAQLVAALDGMPLAIELAAARVEALGVAQLAERLDDRFVLLAGGDRLAPGRHRSLAAAVEWSYRLLGEDERRVFRALSVFPGPFTLAAAEAVAGPGAGPVVASLVDCSLVVPPRAVSDGRWRYGMLEMLRAYGARLLAESTEWDEAAGALAGWAVDVTGQAAAGLQSAEGELAAARWLDAEDAVMRQVLAWAMDHDPDIAVRLAVALVPWWHLRGRLAGQYPLLRQVAGSATPGSDGWCAAQFWLRMAASGFADLAVALGHFTVVCDTIGDRGASRVLVDALIGRAWNLTNMGRTAEAAEVARGALAMAREAGYPGGQADSLVTLSRTAMAADDLGSAVRLAQQAGQITAGIPGWVVRLRSLSLIEMLAAAGEVDAAEDMCAVGLVLSRDTGSLDDLANILNAMTILDLSAGRLEDAATHLREALQVALRTGDSNSMINGLDCCGLLCAVTGRPAEAVTAWAAFAADSRHREFLDWPQEVRRREGPLRQCREALGPDRTRAAEERGAAMSQGTAAEYALMLADPGPSQSAALGPERLSTREWELFRLVAQGRTDAQIAAELYISIRTVRSHLDRIRDKTGCRRRADLTRLALSTGLV
jgi:predicted ATPase/DNA-binding CsgD family transcriptional regulator